MINEMARRIRKYGEKILIVEPVDKTPGQAARLSEILAKNLAMVVCQPDGEDSAGREKYALMAPKDVARRACDIAGELIYEWEERGWMVEIQEDPDEKE